MVDNNYVETVIALPPNLFFGTSIAVNILVLSKHKNDNTTQFINASGEEFFKKETNNNVLTDEHIAHIIKLFDEKENVAHIAQNVHNSDIAANNYNLSVSSYVEAKDTREVIDITMLNKDIAQLVQKITMLRTDIEAIITQIR